MQETLRTSQCPGRCPLSAVHTSAQNHSKQDIGRRTAHAAAVAHGVAVAHAGAVLLGQREADAVAANILVAAGAHAARVRHRSAAARAGAVHHQAGEAVAITA